MEGKTGSYRIRILAAALAAAWLALGPRAAADTVNAKSLELMFPVEPSGPEVPLELRIETDKPVYQQSETVEVLFTVTNLGALDVWIGTLFHPPLNVRVAQDEAAVWQAFSAAPSEEWPPSGPGLFLAAGDSVSVPWDWSVVNGSGQPLGAGEYCVEGRLGWGTAAVLDDEGNVIDNIESGWGVDVGIVVLPEPGACWVLCLWSCLWGPRRKRSAASVD